MFSYLGIYHPFDCVIGEVNITELSSTQLCAFMSIKCILDNMVPLLDHISNLRLEDIASDTDNEEVDFQMIFSFFKYLMNIFQSHNNFI